MTALPKISPTIPELIDAAWEALPPEHPRPHLGASQLGHHCDRYLWLSFRWAYQEKRKGAMLRLLQRGHGEEAKLIQSLRMIGVEVVEGDGVLGTGPDGLPQARQFRVDFGGHVSGSLDGIALSGVPGAPTAPHILEFKTSNRKNFEALQKDGVQKAKPQHWTQMQVYMRGRRIDRSLYLAVCKDDDRLYAERVRLDREAADAAIARGLRIVAMQEPPMPKHGPDWYECKWCPAFGLCHGQDTPLRSCRTCRHARPVDGGAWLCDRWNGEIPTEGQRLGCDEYQVVRGGAWA